MVERGPDQRKGEQENGPVPCPGRCEILRDKWNEIEAGLFADQRADFLDGAWLDHHVVFEQDHPFALADDGNLTA